MGYCPPGVSFFDIWKDHGISDCFMDTTSTSIISGHLLIFGSAQLWMYNKYGSRISRHSIPPSTLYIVQLLMTIFISVLAIFKFILQAVVLNNGAIYGYMVLSTVFTTLIYPLSAILIIVERNYLLPSVPTRGHGLVLLIFWTLMFISENLMFINLHRSDLWFNLKTWTDKLQMALFVLRYITCLIVFVLGLRAPGILTTRDYLNLTSSTASINGEGLTGPPTTSTWSQFSKKVRILAPFVWPRKSIQLQLRVIFCLALLVAGRFINVYVPIYSKLIVDSMTATPLVFRWDLVLTFAAFKFLQGGGTGGMGCLNNLRQFLWIRVQQYTTKEIEVELFRHLHGLSLRWHLGRKTGEVLRVMDRGTDSINNLLSYILFSILPTISDVGIAVIYFILSFNLWFGIIVFCTMFFYILATIMVTEWRTKFQRKMNLADNARSTRSIDSLLNFETVKYYGAEDFEVTCFSEAVNKFQVEEWKSTASLNLLNTLQNIVVTAGLLGGSMLCVYMVTNNHGLTVGDYVLFASYILQLYVPLNWFGTYYRAIQKNFIDMENMFDLLAEKPEVVDFPAASNLVITQGVVEFRNVHFYYNPDRVILKGVSFYVPQGKTLALVGPSGSGKSTIMRLLFRFYDVVEGEILIDGQNIKHVKQASLRRAIGVVPQDTVLFNNTISFNIQYGRVNAPDVDIVSAAKSADIHEKILTFPESYNTQVGERGLKLSGGEKQRVAIARTILKSPAIVLLDEATSALDTQTERNIQSSLARVCANRTTIVIAHRLSTIIHADEIAVLKDGEIVERGRHEDLIKRGGVYEEMWQQQLRAQSDTNSESKEQEKE
uniref:ATP-binding cassette sub-family B member 6 n=1 Tax=Panstrongylus lignarius TaxID=156445 RepID=A0A224XIP0_9HEMI